MKTLATLTLLLITLNGSALAYTDTFLEDQRQQIEDNYQREEMQQERENWQRQERAEESRHQLENTIQQYQSPAAELRDCAYHHDCQGEFSR